MDAGTDWVASRYGWALDFDGSDDYVSTFPGFPGLDFSVTFWVFAGTQTQSIVVLGDFSHAADISDAGSWVVQSENATSTRNYYLAYNAGNSTPIFYGNGATGLQMDIGLWSHFCYTKSGATLRGYKNGLLAWGPNTYASGNVFYKANSEFRIARWASTFTPTRCFLGQLDDMRIYRRCLAEPEIRILNTEPGIGLKPERTSVFFGAQLFNPAWARNSNVLLSPVGAA